MDVAKKLTPQEFRTMQLLGFFLSFGYFKKK